MHNMASFAHVRDEKKIAFTSYLRVFRITQLQLQFTFGSVQLLRMLVRTMFCFLKSWTNTMLNAVYGTSRRTLLLVVFILSRRTPAKLFWEGGRNERYTDDQQVMI